MYPWIVFLHVIGAFGFILAHGASASVSFALRRERNLERIRALLNLSINSYNVMYVSLLLLLVAGIVAGFMGRWWGAGWIWTALGLLIALIVAMSLVGTRYYAQVRKAAGLEYFEAMKTHAPIPPAAPEEMDRLLAASPAMLVAAMGAGGLIVIVWLMMFKPF